MVENSQDNQVLVDMDASASLPSSSSPVEWKYDVFLSFRGADTRKGITIDILDGLNRRGIKAFMDDPDLVVGDSISPTLIAAIKGSRFAIVILSQNYASSTWCLEELREICLSMEDSRILPLFYQVDPTDVRYQKKRSFKEAFSKHESSGRYESEKVNQWRAALYKVANISGWNTNDFKTHEELVDNIVESLRSKVSPDAVEFTNDFQAFGATREATYKVLKALTDDTITAVGVYGMGGVGKTSMVRHVAAQACINGTFNHWIMGVVSQNPDIKNLQDALAEQLGIKLLEETEDGRAARLHKEIMRKEKLLIIVDDVWERTKLSKIGIPTYNELQKCKSKVLLTTRRLNVCHAMKCDEKISLKVLSDQDSWTLFVRNARRSFESPTFVNVAKKVAGECKGLPIELIVVARALGDKDLVEWEKAAQRLEKSQRANPDHEEDAFKCMKLSYDYLKNEEYKSFFLLCCLFPEDHDIEIEDLFRYAIGIGLFGDAETIYEARGTAHAVVKYLINSSLLLESDDVAYVRMHDVVRDTALNIAKSEGGHRFLVKAGCGLDDWSCRLLLDEGCTAISLMHNRIRELPPHLVCPKLQILSLSHNDELRVIPETFFQTLNELRVLDLSRTGISYLPQSFGLLTNLRALYLDFSENLTNISVVGKIMTLEVLSVKYAKLMELPGEIGNLTNLRVLDITSGRIVRIPSKLISRLHSLEELYLKCGFWEWMKKGMKPMSTSMWDLNRSPGHNDDGADTPGAVAGSVAAELVASSSSSSSARRCKYDVFLSFRGPDTRKGITVEIRDQLQRRGVITFMDDRDLEVGDAISPTLIAAIKESRFAIVVLSQNYASSTWCLEELREICLSMEDNRILPLFYNVEPSDVRHRKRSFGEAFFKHETSRRQTSDQMQQWRDALDKVASFSGWDMENFKTERELVEAVVDSVCKRIQPFDVKFTMSTGDFEEFGASRKAMGEVMKALIDDNVTAIGVYGMGGVGKTTLVKHVAAQSCKNGIFDHVIMAVVSQNSDFKKLQDALAEQLGIKLLEETEIGRIGRLNKEIMRREKLLIILDDVWGRTELLIPTYKELQKFKSKVLLTTRTLNVCHVMNCQEKISLNILSVEDSLTLFMRNARIKSFESTAFEKVARRVAGECKGLPIALIAVARALGDKDLAEWEKAAERLVKSQSANPDHEQVAFECIKLSYDYLKDEEYKSFFLLCCLFPEDHDIKIEDLFRYAIGVGLFRDAETIYEARGTAYTVVKYLIDSSLLLESYNVACVRMHDVVRDTALNIAKSEGGHRFLVKAGCGLDDWPCRLLSNEGCTATAISLMHNRIQKLPAQLVCPKLQILLLNQNSDLDKIPKTFFQSAKELRVLNLSLNGISYLPQSFGRLTNLRALYLDDCENLTDISMVGKIRTLEVLSVKCAELQELSREIGNLTNLRVLDITSGRIVRIPSKVISRLHSLEELYLKCGFWEWMKKGMKPVVKPVVKPVTNLCCSSWRAGG